MTSVAAAKTEHNFERGIGLRFFALASPLKAGMDSFVGLKRNVTPPSPRIFTFIALGRECAPTYGRCSQVNRHLSSPLLRCWPVGEAIGPRRKQVQEVPPEQHRRSQVPFHSSSGGNSSFGHNTEARATPWSVRSVCLRREGGR